MWRSLASNMLTFLVVGLFLIGGAILWGQSQYTAEGPLDEAICLRVQSGSNMGKVSLNLAEEGAVSNASIFRIGANYSEKSSQLKAGSFLIEPHSSMSEIVDQITRSGASTCGTEIVLRVGVNHLETQVRELDPATNEFTVTAEFDPAVDETPALYTEKAAEADTRFRISLAEGVTSWQIVEGLKQMPILEGEIATVPPEGTLAPDSYEVIKGASRQELLDKMAASQSKRLADAWESRDDGLPLESAQELLILASIIEKETGIPEERRDVASVFVNRLKQGMRLQTDPTVIYGITKGQGVLGRGLRQSELRGVTPWNTYVIEGLPPTPIASPGAASLEAAAHPAATDFVFFVADGSGGHAFSSTLEEHNRNVAKWRRIEAEKANN